VSVQNAQA